MRAAPARETDRLPHPRRRKPPATDLARHGVTLSDGAEAPAHLEELRITLTSLNAQALARRLYMTCLHGSEAKPRKDNCRAGRGIEAIQARALSGREGGGGSTSGTGD